MPGEVKIVAVSKTKPVSDIQQAFQCGQVIFGENKVQELDEKHQQVHEPVEWHFIGHLQRNKVKYMAGYVSCIHSVDSLKLLKAINKEASKHDRCIDCLLQVHIAKEESKFGFPVNSLDQVLAGNEWLELKNTRVVGLMGMATYTSDEEVVRGEFRSLKKCFDEIKDKYFKNISYFSEISMGMSGDYQVAIEEGATMVRIGSKIFGERNYKNK